MPVFTPKPSTWLADNIPKPSQKYIPGCTFPIRKARRTHPGGASFGARPKVSQSRRLVFLHHYHQLALCAPCAKWCVAHQPAGGHSPHARTRSASAGGGRSCVDSLGPTQGHLVGCTAALVYYKGSVVFNESPHGKSVGLPWSPTSHSHESSHALLASWYCSSLWGLATAHRRYPVLGFRPQGWA